MLNILKSKLKVFFAFVCGAAAFFLYCYIVILNSHHIWGLLLCACLPLVAAYFLMKKLQHFG